MDMCRMGAVEGGGGLDISESYCTFVVALC